MLHYCFLPYVVLLIDWKVQVSRMSKDAAVQDRPAHVDFSQLKTSLLLGKDWIFFFPSHSFSRHILDKLTANPLCNGSCNSFHQACACLGSLCGVSWVVRTKESRVTCTWGFRSLSPWSLRGIQEEQGTQYLIYLNSSDVNLHSLSYKY